VPREVGTVRGKVAVPSNEPVAYVYVENVLAPAAKGRKVVIEQARKTFVPSWAVVQRGTTIAFPNSDTIFHNVFSASPGNTFDLGLYNSAAQGKTHMFSEPGPVDVYCNIHPQMAASVLVVPNRYFVKIKPDGSFEIAGVPAGKRKLVAWAPSSRLTAEWVDVSAEQTAVVTLKLEPKSPRHDNKAGQPYGSYE
jgi:plastocyanin